MRLRLVGIGCSALLGLTACGGSSRLSCGEGTVERNGECVPETSSDGGTAGTNAAGGSGPATGGSGPTTGGSGPATGGAPPGASAEEVERARAMCPTPEEGIAVTPSQAAFEAMLVGRWLYCDGPIVFGRVDAAGIRFDGDGSFAF